MKKLRKRWQQIRNSITVYYYPTGTVAAGVAVHIDAVKFGGWLGHRFRKHYDQQCFEDSRLFM